MAEKKQRVICPYCGEPARYADSAPLYRGVSYGMVWICDPCGAWVGVHKGTDKPLGRLANAELRQWKVKAHAAFDPLWKAKLERRRRERGPEYKVVYARGSGYAWLAGQMGIAPQNCHIGLFDVEQCKLVIDICTNWRARKKEAA